VLSNLPELKRVNSSFVVLNQFERKTRLSTDCPLTNCRGSIRYFQLIKSTFRTSNLQFNWTRFNVRSYGPRDSRWKMEIKEMQSFYYNQRNYLNLVAENIFFEFHVECKSIRSFISASIDLKKNRTCNKRRVIKK